ncbi:MAG: hypothetical protein HY725_10880, partial [Candidatus Rokubacteria bacterium]|nr:hypothetical protein [Candidatus Rokubacteria bacterium]
MVLSRMPSAVLPSTAAAGGGVARPGKRLVFTAALLFGYAIVLEPLGYVAATFLLMWGLFAEGGGAKRLAYEPAPLVLAFVLGPMLERELRQALIISGGDLGVFLTRPLSAASLL